MKIGIVTIYDNRNFGNRLQNYALQQVLLRYADRVVTIKNKPALPKWTDRLRRGTFLAESLVANWLLGEKRKLRMLQFNREYLHVTKTCYWYNREYPALKRRDRCDYYCVGSDQVWNPALDRTGSFSYLGFAPREAAFSYAASFGVAEIPQADKAAVRKGLEHLGAVSLRETRGLVMAEALTGREDLQRLPDPALLLQPEEWETLQRRPEHPLPPGYLLCCFLGTVSQARRSAIFRRAQQENLEVMDIMDRKSPFYEIGPCEYLYLIAHAELVCTDSYHAGIFSFLFQRPVILFDRQGECADQNGRLAELVSRYGLACCFGNNSELPGTDAIPDYDAAFQVLQSERAAAKQYLDTVLLGQRVGK